MKFDDGDTKDLVLGNCTVLATGSRILTGTDTYYGGKRMSTALPFEQRNVILGKTVIVIGRIHRS